MKKTITSSGSLLSYLVAVAMMMVVQSTRAEYVKLTALNGMNDQNIVSEYYDKLIDANIGTKWGSGFNPNLEIMYIIVKAEKAVIPKYYFLVTGNDTEEYPDRNWTSWKIYGGNFESDDQAVRGGTGWTLIDVREDEPLPAQNFGVANLKFSEVPMATYQYFWIEVEKTVANGQVYQQMSEWGLGTYAEFEQYLENLPNQVTGKDEPVKYFVISGDPEGFSGEGISNLFDDNVNTKWCCNFTNRNEGEYTNGGHIIFKASRAMAPSYYSLTTANDVRSHPDRNWKQWRIYGMNADSDETVKRESEEWVLLDKRYNIGANQLPAANYFRVFFNLSEECTTTYRYFKVELDQIVSSGRMQMSEFSLFDQFNSDGIPVNGEFSNIITFADKNVKAICVANWDTNGDGELSEAEAAAVTSLGNVFTNNTLITTFNELQYFTSLTFFGEWAFSGCSNLTSITIPNSLTNIGRASFYGCSNLTSVTIGNSVTIIDEWAFAYCSNLYSISIPNSVTIIGRAAFIECSNLTSVTIPSSVTTIGAWAFSNSNLVSVNISVGVNCIGDHAFWSCDSLKSITIPNSVSFIGNWAFAECSSLTSVTIPNSLVAIDETAFYECI